MCQSVGLSAAPAICWTGRHQSLLKQRCAERRKREEKDASKVLFRMTSQRVCPLTLIDSLAKPPEQSSARASHVFWGRKCKSWWQLMAGQLSSFHFISYKWLLHVSVSYLCSFITGDWLLDASLSPFNPMQTGGVMMILNPRRNILKPDTDPFEKTGNISTSRNPRHMQHRSQISCIKGHYCVRRCIWIITGVWRQVCSNDLT